MQQKWWLVAAGVVGIGLAVLLFPRPDTGGPPSTPPARHVASEGVPVPRPALEALPGDPAGNGPRVRAVTRRDEATAPLRPELAVERNGPNPIAALNMKNVTPEAIHAGRAAGPWTVIRRQLLRMEGDPDAQAFSEQFAPMVEQLRTLRTDPESADYAQLEEQQRKYLDVVKSNPAWMSDEIVKASVERLELIHDAYHEAIAARSGDGEE